MGSRSCIPKFLVVLFLLASTAVLAHAQPVQFTRLTDAVDGPNPIVTAKEAARYERFLSAVFPLRPMKRFVRENEKPVVRRVAYTVVEQQRQRFIIAAYTGRWKSAVNVLGIYRVSGGPIQVWRSIPWEATYYDMHLTTAAIGPRTMVLFREGGETDSYGLGSVFTFRNAREGLILEDISPANPVMRVRTRFPFRPILAQNIHLQIEDDGKPFLLLTASDDEYVLPVSSVIRPTVHWRFDRARNRFDRITPNSSWQPQVTTLLDRAH